MNWFVEFCCRLWASFPRPVVRWLGSWIGILWFDILRIRRRIVLDNIARAFPGSGKSWRRKIGRKSLRLAGANFAEFFTLPAIDQEWVQEHAQIEGWKFVEEALKQERGILFLSLHMGPYDIASSLIAMRGLQVFLISKFFKSEWLNRIWFSIRGAKGVHFIDPHGETTAFDILKALKKQAGVIFVLDQYMGKPFGIKTKFFGVETGTAYGLALFALKTRAPVVPVYAREAADGKVHLIFEKSIPFVEVADKDEGIRLTTQAYNDVLEAIIRRYPEEWLWVHRRWKKFEE